MVTKFFLDNFRDCVAANKTAKTENLIRILNPKIMGWANYYRSVVSKKTFSYVDHQSEKAGKAKGSRNTGVTESQECGPRKT
ncbi:MAG: hypothetical protein H7318_13570 [Oligoflexus sp.]|nr:hypothetical protein [Oligoflexus sp.]